METWRRLCNGRDLELRQIVGQIEEQLIFVQNPLMVGT